MLKSRSNSVVSFLSSHSIIFIIIFTFYLSLLLSPLHFSSSSHTTSFRRKDMLNHQYESQFLSPVKLGEMTRYIFFISSPPLFSVLCSILTLNISERQISRINNICAFPWFLFNNCYHKYSFSKNFFNAALRYDTADYSDWFNIFFPISLI